MRQTINISKYKELKLNSFHPICKTELGKKAILTYNYPAYIDASCRREPDFENPNPSISSICRASKFAPHLEENDVIFYITIKGNYPGFEEDHYRAIAILQVAEVYLSHQQGQLEYSKLNFPIPSNCIVSTNPPHPFVETAGNFNTKKELEEFLNTSSEKQLQIGNLRLQSWDKLYLYRSRKWPCFIRTIPLYLNLKDPCPIFQSDLDSIFGKRIGTRSGKKITEPQLIKLANLIGIDLTFNKMGS